jgi:hypothetical protein
MDAREFFKVIFWFIFDKVMMEGVWIGARLNALCLVECLGN